MKITSVKALNVTVPFQPEDQFHWSGGSLTEFSTTFVLVETDAGISGLGESYNGVFAPSITAAAIEHLAPLILGKDPLAVGAHVNRMYRSGLFWGRSGMAVGALSAIENALWDISGKAHDVPVYSLLGGPIHSSLTMYASGGLERPLDMTRREVAGYIDEGYRAMKIRIGYGAKRDEAKVAAVREVIGNDVMLMVDAVQGHNPKPWSAAEAMPVVDALGQYGLTWFEEACGAYDYAGYARVRDRARMPISGGESSCMLYEFQNFFRLGALDFAQPDASHAGGILECLRIAAAADAVGARIAPHAWGSAPNLMANYHFAFACPNAFVAEFPTIANPLRTEMMTEPMQVQDGKLLPPTAPGLGVHLSTDILNRYPFREGSAFYA